MMKEAFEQEILHQLNIQSDRYPAMQRQDTVKFVFQAMLGVGHLLASRDAAEEYLAREMDPLPADASEPLTEMLSPAWCRLNLRAAKARKLTPAVIAGLMCASDVSVPFTRQDVYRFCARLMPDSGETDRIPEEGWLPSHSPEYRERYHPAYRVIAADWIPCLDIIQRIAGQQADRVLVTIDGPCASGKTTLAEKLAGVFGAAAVHTDDFVIPHAQKTAERLAVPGGNCDADRLAGEVAAPWKRGAPVVFRRYDCRQDCLLPEETLPDGRILILEGSYCNLPEIRKHADVRVFMDTAREIREERLRQRESAQSLQMFHDRWIPLENRYFEAFGLPDPACAVLKNPR